MDCGSPFGHCACPKEIPLGDVFCPLKADKKHTEGFLTDGAPAKAGAPFRPWRNPAASWAMGADFPPFSSRYPTKLYPYVKNV